MHAAVMTATSSVEDVFAASGSELVSRLGPRNGLPNIRWCTSAAYASKISKPATKRRSWAASRRPWCNVCFARSLCTQAHEQQAVLPAARRGASASSVQRRHAAAWIDAPDHCMHTHLSDASTVGMRPTCTSAKSSFTGYSRGSKSNGNTLNKATCPQGPTRGPQAVS
eukprot:scaffold5309_cov175-Prasinococcus_capsulatus_cf.AAC.1